jgi:protoporphyrin/coproporphyrin ferrochelatase
LLLAYGGPESLDDIPAYLLDIRGGRETPQSLIDEISQRYAAIGGKSPLLEITQRAARKLSEKAELPVYVGMRHWHPYIKDVVGEMAADGVRQMIVICMAPHYSTMSIGVYRRKVDEALAAVAEDISLSFVDSWGTQPSYLEGIVANTRDALARFAPDVREGIKLIFTAHSLPASILERGDPYDTQLRETARLLADRLELPVDRWTFCYQSAAQTGTPWLGPPIESLVPQLAGQGEHNLVIVPIGFIADHVEVLYDLDIGVQKIAAQHEVRVERAQTLNDSDVLVDALAQLVNERIADGRAA